MTHYGRQRIEGGREETGELQKEFPEMYELLRDVQEASIPALRTHTIRLRLPWKETMERYFKHTLWRMEKPVLLLPKRKLPTQLSTILLNLTERKPILIRQHTLRHQHQHLILL